MLRSFHDALNQYLVEHSEGMEVNGGASKHFMGFGGGLRFCVGTYFTKVQITCEIMKIHLCSIHGDGSKYFYIPILCSFLFFLDLLQVQKASGDRIYGVFDNQVTAALKKLPFDRHLSINNVKKVVSEADGYQAHLIAPEQGYRRLDSKGPAKASVDAELVEKSLNEMGRVKEVLHTYKTELALAANAALECNQAAENSHEEVLHTYNLNWLLRKCSLEVLRVKEVLHTSSAEWKYFFANEALERFREDSRKTTLRYGLRNGNPRA
ncbi:hypothetical protein IFM89_005295 [Coptis chinensis]|uniref:Uncharacterized protein n=1 Tax=Coptis chinensis TaxID=261450 RepID=A0A835IYB5_9MAGN|nr:hypothetical protein IFM89_005295 [Coptis chinensis]